MIGFLTYLPTVAYIPHLLYVLIILYLLIRKGKNINFGKLSNLFIIILIIVLSVLNNFYHSENFEKPTDYIPFLILMIITYLAALNFNKNDAKILVYLVALESVVIFVESLYGVSTFFTGLDKFIVFKKGSLMYFNRPLGLSENSSTAALKIMAAFLLIHFYSLKGKFIKISVILLFIGFVLTFNRTVIVALLFFYGLVLLLKSVNLNISKFRLSMIMILLSVITIGFMVYSDTIMNTMVNQFTRNSGKIELTGRGTIWKYYIEFIQHHFFTGNGSFKYMLDTYIRGRVFHAHNSYLQTIATHGFIIFLLYIILILKNINKYNYLYILTIMIYSISQYGIFWGVSLLDIVFFVFLFTKGNNFFTKQKALNNE